MPSFSSRRHSWIDKIFWWSCLSSQGNRVLPLESGCPSRQGQGRRCNEEGALVAVTCARCRAAWGPRGEKPCPSAERQGRAAGGRGGLPCTSASVLTAEIHFQDSK